MQAKQKKRIVHVIDDLGRGGAETLLVDLLPDLAGDYEIILVTLGNTVEFDAGDIVCKERISLDYKGIRDIPFAALRLRKLIKKYRPHLVRSQLYWSTIITRLACPKNIPYFFSVHATMNEDPIAAYKRHFINTLERITYRKRQHMIGVTKAVIDSFKAFHPQHGSTYLLHNFVRNTFFKQSYPVRYDWKRPLRLVSVSNIRLIKNIPYLVEALKLLPQDKVVLDIYGDGPLKGAVEEMIKSYGLNNIQLKGKRADIYNVLPAYDVFVSPSTVEGFGIAVAEAMSVGLPVLISDIPVYREIGGDKAHYIDNKSPGSLAAIIEEILSGKINLAAEGEANKQYAKQLFSKAGYVSRLKDIYTETQTQK